MPKRQEQPLVRLDSDVDATYNFRQVQKLLRCSNRTLYQLVNDNILPSVKTPRQRLFPKHFIDKLIADRDKETNLVKQLIAKNELYMLWYSSYAHIPWELFSHNPKRFINQMDD